MRGSGIHIPAVADTDQIRHLGEEERAAVHTGERAGDMGHKHLADFVWFHRLELLVHVVLQPGNTEGAIEADGRIETFARREELGSNNIDYFVDERIARIRT